MKENIEILLASDFSARSDRPLDRAILLARNVPARLAIAHVIEGDGQSSPEDACARIEEKMRADLPDAARDAELIVRQGEVPDVLGRIIAERKSDIIVTGVARYNSIGDYILGTAVAYIIAQAGIPVLVVRKRPKTPYRKILVATNFSRDCRAALLFAVDLFPDASFVALHAYHVPYQGWLKSDDTTGDIRAEHQEYMDKFLSDLPVSEAVRKRISPVVAEGELNGVVMRSVESQGADLLVLGAEMRDGARVAVSGVLEGLLAIVETDVLVVPAR